jgi:uncharacterized protein (TIGR02246 family)
VKRLPRLPRTPLHALPVLLVAVLFGCVSPEAPPAAEGADLAAEAAAIRAASEAWYAHVNAHDIEATVALYTPDAVILEPGFPPISGTDAIRASFEDFFAMQPRNDGSEILEIEVAASGDLAWERGRSWGGYVEDGEARSFDGPYLLVWKRAADGWRIHREMFFSDGTSP